MLPILKTDRLLLRNISIDDALDMYEYAKTTKVGPSAGWEPHVSIEETKLIIKLFKDNASKTGLGTFAIIWKETGKMIGTIEIYNVKINHSGVLGYSLSDKYWGRGIMVEACHAVISWAIANLHLQRIEISLFVDNHQSERVCEKLGFTYEGIRRKGYNKYNSEAVDEKIYSLTDNDYFKYKEEGLYGY